MLLIIMKCIITIIVHITKLSSKLLLDYSNYFTQKEINDCNLLPVFTGEADGT